jgi:hypothetical protein
MRFSGSDSLACFIRNLLDSRNALHYLRLMKPSPGAASMGIVAAILFGFGLTGGLAPSEGQPSLMAWLVYAIVPFGLTLLGLLVVKSWVVRALLMVEAGGIVALTINLLRLFHVF